MEEVKKKGENSTLTLENAVGPRGLKEAKTILRIYSPLAASLYKLASMFSTSQ